jgi:hypothetical protein
VNDHVETLTTRLWGGDFRDYGSVWFKRGLYRGTHSLDYLPLPLAGTLFGCVLRSIVTLIDIFVSGISAAKDDAVHSDFPFDLGCKSRLHFAIMFSALRFTFMTMLTFEEIEEKKEAREEAEDVDMKASLPMYVLADAAYVRYRVS